DYYCQSFHTGSSLLF
nr:immunoglobulin light chain junction region [Macaca mulatta]MOX28562.1 immunoglobulin light chain junction region [Macaca mulatta]MOX29197.1 immunoglobulin light chain junction region [Macaca mulatta]MOX29262.1 immunoglobulin light chain junction region [Macaca mulatta]MOX29911.1 immunoglobulin light chain junction region [Macaca mulatta]